MINNLVYIFSKIQNAQLTKKPVIFLNKKKLYTNILKLLWFEGFILGYKLANKKIKLFLKYFKNKSAITFLKVISKSSLKFYFSANQIWKIKTKRLVFIFSTNKGLKTLLNCKRQNIGGKLLIILD